MSYDGSVSGTNSYVQTLALMAVVDPTDTNFTAILPATLQYAENRIYRELDFLFTSTANTSYSLTLGSRAISVPSGTFVVLEQINVITPAGVTDPNIGTRNPLLPTTKEYLDAVYGQASSTGLPKYFVPFNDDLFLVGPYPDASYQVELIGTFRPTSLSASNPTTFISLYLPDLLIQASMIYISEYQRNFSGASSNDPNMPQTYEMQYQALLRGAMGEEQRKGFMAAAWSSMAPSPIATPTRG